MSFREFWDACTKSEERRWADAKLDPDSNARMAGYGNLNEHQLADRTIRYSTFINAEREAKAAKKAEPTAKGRKRK